MSFEDSKKSSELNKSMKALRRLQLNDFFEACQQELDRCKRDYTIDLDNDDLMFDQEFFGIQERIDKIESEIINVNSHISPSKYLRKFRIIWLKLIKIR